MKRFLILSNGRVVDTKNIDADLVTQNINDKGMSGLVIKGEKLFKIYKSEDTLHHEDERIELGFIVFETDNEDEARERGIDCRIEHMFSLIEEDRWKDCNRINDCGSCWRYSDRHGVCGDDLVEFAVQSYQKKTLNEEDMKAIQNVVAENIDRRKIRSVLFKIGEKLF